MDCTEKIDIESDALRSTNNALTEICATFDDELTRFYAGDSSHAYKFFGCHYIGKKKSHLFAVWAPNAKSVRVVGDFNNWDENSKQMSVYRGIFVTLVPGLKDGDTYKYYIEGADNNFFYKADPFAFYAECPPNTASRVCSLDAYEWHDKLHIKAREKNNLRKSPVSIYELQLGSWRKFGTDPEAEYGNRYPNYREIADALACYVRDMGFTHVELMPVNEYPYDGSWGYQVTGFFAISSRFGTPYDFMYFVDTLHKAGIGVIVDWVPAHFPKDAHGLAYFDGTWLYEHKSKLRREHPQWGTYIFNYNRPEVVSFLVSSANLLADVYHLDGIRVDAVSSMLYLDFGRDGNFVRNEQGGNIDFAAVDFIRKFNSAILTEHTGVITIAEESTAYPLVTRPPFDNGLGFSYKWNMGYMNDTLSYMEMDSYFRGSNHDKLTFLISYAFSENFILPYSHDEVVHGKKSMIEKMFGDYNQKFASLKTLYAWTFAHPGKKLLFMGDEFAQFIEWNYKGELDWPLLGYETHRDMQDFVRELNVCYKAHPALYENDENWDGFLWLIVDDRQRNVFAFVRTSLRREFGERETSRQEQIVCVFNFSPVAYVGYRLPQSGKFNLILDTSGSIIDREPTPGLFTLPPLSAQYYTLTH
jgi:1,4-alpha-glucan branching enzyme